MKKKGKKEKIGEVQSDFVTLTSHQLRTPLSGMKWLLELLQKGGAGSLNKKQKEFVDKIYASNERVIALVNDLLEVSRIETGKNKLYLQKTDLTPIVRDILKEKASTIKKKRLQISFTTEQEPFPLVLTEPNKIKQALNNIVTNAINYSPDGSMMTIDLKKQDDLVLCQIADSGSGIPKQQQKLVFSKFFRGDNIVRFETNGTGLGLFITRAFIEASGGRIWFKSEEGKGTTFYFTLPLAK